MHRLRLIWLAYIAILCLSVFALQSGTATAATVTRTLTTHDRVASANCGTPAYIAKLTLGWDISVLNQKYQHATTPRLCDDKWAWSGMECLPTSTILSTLGWPADLVQAQYLNQITCVPARPAPTPTPTPTPAPQPSGNCTVGGFLGVGFDFCAAIGVIFQHLVLEPIKAANASIVAQSSFIWKTPDLTQSSTNGSLTDIWKAVLWLVDGGVVLAVLWHGINLVRGKQSWFIYANVVGDLPRILFAVLAAHFSLHFFQILIDGNNAISGMFGTDHQLIGLLNMTTAQGFDQFLQAFYGIMALLLAFAEIARIALLSILLVFAPFWMFLWSLSETQTLARICTTATIGLAFLQAAQIGVADVGGHLMATLSLGTAPTYTLLNLLSGIVVLYIDIFLLPKWLSAWIFQTTGGVRSAAVGAMAAVAWAVSHI